MSERKTYTLGVGDFKRGLRDVGFVLTVRTSRPLRFRLWLAVQLARLAGWVAGVPTEEEGASGMKQPLEPWPEPGAPRDPTP